LRRRTKLVSVLSAGILALALAACGDDGDSGDGDGDGATSDVKVGFAYDVGGRGDESFNDSAAAGLDQAIDEFGMEAQESEAELDEPETARAERLRTFADAGYDPIIAVGFAYAPAVAEVAAEYPDLHFAIIDDATLADVPNVASLVFAEEQGSFLVGAAAALKSEAGHIGFIGGVETPLILKFQAGYEAGAKAVNPDINVDVTYLTQAPDFSGFNDPAKGKTAAEGMFDAGADVVYHAAGGSGGGLFEAAQAAGKLAIGVDADQYNQQAYAAVKDVILTSMIKRVDIAVFEFITSAVEGEPLAGTTVFDLEAEGVGYSTSNPAVEEYAEGVEDFAAQIVDGSITVPTSP
jgi:basic membrane protein A